MHWLDGRAARGTVASSSRLPLKAAPRRRGPGSRWPAAPHQASDLTRRGPPPYFATRNTIAPNHQERGMRIYYDINLTGPPVTKRELHGEEIVRAGRYLIAKTLLELGAATVEPLSPANPLVFSAGPFAGTSLSNANRTCVGSKRPLTAAITED